MQARENKKYVRKQQTSQQIARLLVTDKSGKQASKMQQCLQLATKEAGKH